jgi:hypothetical protein
MQRQGKEDDMQSTQATDWTELAQRIDGGVAITLLWSQRGSRVKVAVADEWTGEQFEVEICPSDALSAFYHPFAHRPSRDAPWPQGAEAAAPSRGVRRHELDAAPTNPWDDAEEWE